MTIQIDQLALGALQTNCYLVGDSSSGDALIIDPSAEEARILAQVQERGYTVREILITHTHFDHILASLPVQQATGASVRLHKDSLAQMQIMRQRAAAMGLPSPDGAAEPTSFLEHGDIVSVGPIHLEARFTPGHSPGHLSFVMHEQRVAFVGDAIFYEGFGRTDLPGADAATLKHSIVSQILSLPDDFTLLSGHGPATTVGREKYESAALAYLLNSVD